MQKREKGITPSQFINQVEKRVKPGDRIISYQIVIRDAKNTITITNKERCNE